MMKRSPVSLVLLLAACASSAPRTSVSVPPSRPEHRAAQEPPEVKDSNFILVMSESVPNPDDDGPCFAKVFIDGHEVGKTDVGRRSEEHVLKLKLPLGNQPARLEYWFLPAVGEWTRLDDSRQSRERFVRVEEGSLVRLSLRFSEGQSSNVLTISRESVPR